MKKIAVISFIVALFVGCGGASSVDRAMAQVEKAIEKIEKNKGKLTESDWQILEKEVEEPLRVLSDAVENNKVGAIQKIKLITLSAKWATVVMEAGLTEIERETGVSRENWQTELEKATKEIENSTQELEKALQGIDKTELEKAAKEIENASKELEKAVQGIK